MTISRGLHWLRHRYGCMCAALILMHVTYVCVCVCVRVYCMYSAHTLIESSLNRAYTHERLRFVAFTSYMPGTHLLPTANRHCDTEEWEKEREREEGKGKCERQLPMPNANFGPGFFNLRLLERLLAGREIVCKNILIELSPRFLCCFLFCCCCWRRTHTHTRIHLHTLTYLVQSNSCSFHYLLSF